MNNKQELALQKLSKNVADCLTLPHHDKDFLLRWLIAQNLDVAAAEKMFREALSLRKKWGIDTIMDWPFPEVIERCFLGGISGFDKEGSPILILPHTNIDLHGLFCSTSKENFVKASIKMCERAVISGRKQSKKFGPEAEKVVVIMDMAKVGFREFKNFISPPIYEAVFEILHIVETVYPEILKSCYIINASNVIYIGLSLIKKCISSRTMKNISVYNNSTLWKQVLLKKIDIDQLPVLYGGSQTDPDGNPACELKIKYPSKVPLGYYLVNQTSGKNSNYSITTVKAGVKLYLLFQITERLTFICWSFFTETYDIEFSIVRHGDLPGELIVELAPKRVSGRPVKDEGMFQCQEIGNYVVTFDNTYSYFNKKKLHYSVILVKDPSNCSLNTTNANK